tara:strand:+ start:7161 stop:7526 length:366 start_codon:yes stop_codon:yes gene_type:complete
MFNCEFFCAGKALGKQLVFSVSEFAEARYEVGKTSGCHNQRNTIPVAAGITLPLTNFIIKRAAAIQWNDARVVNHFGHDYGIILVLKNLRKRGRGGFIFNPSDPFFQIMQPGSSIYPRLRQ